MDFYTITDWLKDNFGLMLILGAILGLGIGMDKRIKEKKANKKDD